MLMAMLVFLHEFELLPEWLSYLDAFLGFYISWPFTIGRGLVWIWLATSLHVVGTSIIMFLVGQAQLASKTRALLKIYAARSPKKARRVAQLEDETISQPELKKLKEGLTALMQEKEEELERKLKERQERMLYLLGTKKHGEDSKSSRSKEASAYEFPFGGSVLFRFLLRYLGVDLSQTQTHQSAAFTAAFQRKQTQLSGETCAICWDAFADGDKISFLTDCFHPYHSDCIAIWLQRSAQVRTCSSPFYQFSFVPYFSSIL